MLSRIQSFDGQQSREQGGDRGKGRYEKAGGPCRAGKPRPGPPGNAKKAVLPCHPRGGPSRGVVCRPGQTC
jgi:hypothetical protein